MHKRGKNEGLSSCTHFLCSHGYLGLGKLNNYSKKILKTVNTNVMGMCFSISKNWKCNLNCFRIRKMKIIDLYLQMCTTRFYWKLHSIDKTCLMQKLQMLHIFRIKISIYFHALENEFGYTKHSSLWRLPVQGAKKEEYQIKSFMFLFWLLFLRSVLKWKWSLTIITL